MNVDFERLRMDLINYFEGAYFAGGIGYAILDADRARYATEDELIRLDAKKIEKEDIKYVSAGADVKITDNNNNDISGATVENITENKEENDIRDLSIIMPANSLSIGQSGDFSISKDAGPYSCCVPLSALYQENGKVYVYVTDTENTVLGTVMVARKVEVTVQDRNQTIAALGEGSLSTDQAVIVQADRELKDGSRVRISEN